MFAKLFEPQPGRQVLVKLDSGDYGPEVRTYCEPANLGVCSIAESWPDTDEGWAAAEKVFEAMTEERAVLLADKIYASAAVFAG